jgi:multiple sugar transport system ATP-binding protein
VVKKLGTTTLHVTHDQIEALSLGDRVAVVNKGEIVQCDTPMEVYDRPRTRFVGEFIGTPPMNFLRARATGPGRVRVGEVDLDAPGLDGHDGQVLLGVGPSTWRWPPSAPTAPCRPGSRWSSRSAPSC